MSISIPTRHQTFALHSTCLVKNIWCVRVNRVSFAAHESSQNTSRDSVLQWDSSARVEDSPTIPNLRRRPDLESPIDNRKVLPSSRFEERRPALGDRYRGNPRTSQTRPSGRQGTDTGPDLEGAENWGRFEFVRDKTLLLSESGVPLDRPYILTNVNVSSPVSDRKAPIDCKEFGQHYITR